MSIEAYRPIKNDKGELRSVIVDHVRVSYPSLYEKAKFGGVDQARGYQVTTMLHKKKHAETYDFLRNLLQEHLDTHDVNSVKDSLCFLADGDDTERPEYAGHWIVKTKNSRKPAVYGRGSLIEIKDAAENPIYAGCYANIKLTVWSQKKRGTVMVLADLVALQFDEDGDAFGGGHATAAAKSEGFSGQYDDFLAAA